MQAASRPADRSDAPAGACARPLFFTRRSVAPRHRGFSVPTPTLREVADMADAAIRADEDLDPDAGEDPAQVNTLRNVLVSEATGPFTADRKAVVRFAGVPVGDTFRRGRRDRTDENWPRCWPEAGSRVPAAAGGWMHATALGLAADETSLGSRRLRRPQPHPPTAGGSLGPGGGCRLGVGVSGFSTRRHRTLTCGMSEAAGRPWSRIFEPAAWRAAAGCRRCGGASRASSISSRSGRR